MNTTAFWMEETGGKFVVYRQVYLKEREEIDQAPWKDLLKRRMELHVQEWANEHNKKVRPYWMHTDWNNPADPTKPPLYIILVG